MPTLHLIDAASPQARPTTLALLAATARAQTEQGEQTQVVLLGGPALGHAGEAAGLHDAQRVAVPFGRAELGAASLRHARRNMPRPGTVYAWSAGALRVATWLWSDAVKFACLTREPNEAMCAAIERAERQSAPLSVVALDTFVAQGLPRRISSHGGLAVSVADAPVLPPTMLPPDDQAGERVRLRKLWGCEQAGTGERVVALLSDPPEAGDAWHGTLTLGLVCEAITMHLADPPMLALLVHPSQYKRQLAQHLVAQAPSRIRIIQDARLAAPWQVFAGCDAVLTPQAESGGLAIAAAMAAGVPVVGPDSPRLRQQISHDHNGLLASSSESKRLAPLLQQLLLERHRAARLGAAARDVAGDMQPWLQAIAAAEALFLSRRV